MDANIEYKIIHQKNRGVSEAINAGLSEVTGDYLCWPDADDYFEPTSVEDRINALDEHLDCAIVTSNAYVRNENQLDRAELYVSGNRKRDTNPRQFFYLLNGDSIFCDGCHMVRMKAFEEVCPDRTIYPSKHGQNWQMLLPVYFNFKRYFLNKPLYNYIVYQNSKSHTKEDYRKKLVRANAYETIIHETLYRIEKTQKCDLSQYHRYISDRYAKLRMNMALQYKDRTGFADCYVQKKKNLGLDLLDRCTFCCYKHPNFEKEIFLFLRIIRRIYCIRDELMFMR